MIRTAVLACLLVFAGSTYAGARELSCKDERKQRSLRGDVKSKITFANRTKQLQRIFWIDYDGRRQNYHELDPGESYVQPTFLTHPWLVADRDDNCLGLYLPTRKARTVAAGNVEDDNPRVADRRNFPSDAIDEGLDFGSNNSDTSQDYSLDPGDDFVEIKPDRRDEFCRSARTLTEKTICQNRNLVRIDGEMNELYQQVTKLLPEHRRERLRRRQRRWLENRDNCGDRERCIEQRMENRLAGLNRRLERLIARRNRQGGLPNDDRSGQCHRSSARHAHGFDGRPYWHRHDGEGCTAVRVSQYDIEQDVYGDSLSNAETCEPGYEYLNGRCLRNEELDDSSLCGPGYRENNSGRCVSNADGGGGDVLPVRGRSFGGKVRRAPGLRERQITSLQDGDPVTIVANTGERLNGYDWFQIRFRGRNGYHWGGIMCSDRPVRGIYQVCR